MKLLDHISVKLIYSTVSEIELYTRKKRIITRKIGLDTRINRYNIRINAHTNLWFFLHSPVF